MPLIAPAKVLVHPSFMEPDTVMQYSQVSGAFMLLPKGLPRVKLGSEDLAVYMKRLDLRTKVATGQSTYNMLPTVEPVFSLLSTPTYNSRLRYEYDHHDSNNAAEWGHSITQLYQYAGRQAIYQFMRTALINGINPSLGEGLANTPGATAANLPADPYGNVTVSTYDNGAMALLLLQILGTIKQNTNNLGVPRGFTILAPQRVLRVWQYNIVQLTSYQRAGGGTESTAGTTKGVAGELGDEVLWATDDTLIGKGSGGADLIIFVMPEIEVPDAPNEIDTNYFARIKPGFLETTAMYCDMVAPRELTVPLAGGAVDTLMELRHSSGWGVRPEATYLLSANF